VSLDGQYASWVGTLVRPEQPLIVLVDAGRLEEAVLRLARVGYENVVGVIEGDPALWAGTAYPLATLERLPAAEWTADGRAVLDVRRRREWDGFHIEGATHIPLAELPERLVELDRETEWVVVCASGYRSGIASSLLQQSGFARVVNGTGGMEAWRGEGLPVT
jgi:rhodanese-related sulfurtransferase